MVLFFHCGAALDRRGGSRNCRRGAGCEQSWATLDLLPDADLRFCKVCRKPVHLVSRPEQLWEEIAAGRCVTMTTI